jgi:hypothetical protein
MAQSTDPLLQRLVDDFDAAKMANVPDLAEVRKRKKRIIEYFTWCVLEEMRKHARRADRGPRFRIIANDGPLLHNSRRMSSPMKTPELRNFEDRVRYVFGIDSTAMTEWLV